MNLAGRAIQRSGDAPAAADGAHRVELGRLLRGVYVQAQGAAIDISWNATDWVQIAPGPAQHFLVSEPCVHVRAAGAGARYSVVGVLV